MAPWSSSRLSKDVFPPAETAAANAFEMPGKVSSEVCGAIPGPQRASQVSCEEHPAATAAAAMPEAEVALTATATKCRGRCRRSLPSSPPVCWLCQSS